MRHAMLLFVLALSACDVAPRPTPAPVAIASVPVLAYQPAPPLVHPAPPEQPAHGRVSQQVAAPVEHRPDIDRTTTRAGVVRTGEAIVGGEGLSRDDVRRGIRYHLDRLASCYDRGLEAHPTASGRVMLDFVVDPRGRVAESRVSASTLALPSVERCMVDASREWRFRPPARGLTVHVSLPFVLDMRSDR